MNTPIYDFLSDYASKAGVRFHMPGHHGREFLGCEKLDITEIKGADSLYEADGIIAGSESNASRLFGSGATFFSTEGSSQCIRAMLYLTVTISTKRLILAARNVHKSFVYAAGLIGFGVEWLCSEGNDSLCGCEISPQMVAERLDLMSASGDLPCAVYVTSPNYLGGMLDISGIAKVCHERGVLLLVDNAHGAYLRFLPESLHPLDLGADLCCDSAHKTLPVLTGGAYLHLSRNLPDEFISQAKVALEIFGSTSPSYLILASLDLCNDYLDKRIRGELSERLELLARVRERLAQNGWVLADSDPLKLTISVPDGLTGERVAELLRASSIECEYADSNYVVLMTTPQNPESDFERLISALGVNSRRYSPRGSLPSVTLKRAMSIREALFAPHEFVPVGLAVGRVCGAPTVACPPAIPIAVSGELIDDDAAGLFRLYGVGRVEVVRC